MTAQESNGNEIPPYCTCLNFVYACTGMPATALVGGSVTISCGQNSYDYTIGTDGEGNPMLCPTDGVFSCFGTIKEPAVLCISEGNWEVCSINGCTVTVDQTLTVEPRINGTLLGYGEYLVQSGGVILCEGKNYTGALNTEADATDLFVCPGDQLILDLEDLDIPVNSGMCLYVTMYDTDWNQLDQAIFIHSGVINGTVDVTGLFDDLGTDETYIISMRLKCCTGDDCFETNAYRYAYINVEGQFGYDPYATGLAGSPGFVPDTSLPGSQLGPPDCVTVPGICLNAITFFGNNVVNTQGVDVQYQLIKVDCPTGAPQGSPLHSGTVPGNDPFATGAMLVLSTRAVGCSCFRLDLTYDDGCGAAPVTDSYYFKDGTDCFDPDDPPVAVDELVRPNTGQTGFGIKINPVRGSSLVFEQFGEVHSMEGSLELIVHDATGRKVLSRQMPAGGHQFTVPFDAVPGVYFYSVLIEGQVFTGKFVKQ